MTSFAHKALSPRNVLYYSMRFRGNSVNLYTVKDCSARGSFLYIPTGKFIINRLVLYNLHVSVIFKIILNGYIIMVDLHAVLNDIVFSFVLSVCFFIKPCDQNIIYFPLCLVLIQ